MTEVDWPTIGCEANGPDDNMPAAWGSQEKLDALVTGVATRFMDASSETLECSLTQSLQEMSEFFGVDTSFLRRNDHDRGLSVLVAEWPPRLEVPDPDPLGAVPFSADPVFTAAEHLDQPFVVRPDATSDDYQARVKGASGIDGVSMAMVPLLRKGRTDGILGFIRFGDRLWSTPELNALQAIASLIVQLQARVHAEERLTFQAFHDDLTGLSNRRSLVEELDTQLSKATEPTGLFFVDIDRFKSVNGFLGHQAGDEFLRAVGSRLAGLVRQNDLVARLAGNEFVIVFRGLAGGDDAVAVAERVLAVLREPIAIGGNEIIRTGSVGIAIARAGALSSEELLRNADVAMRRAKSAGGDRAVLFDEVLRREEDERSGTEIELRRAIDTGELLLHYQPEIDLLTGELTAFEALVRWNHPERGLLAAGQFIEVAEETGLIVDLGRWVIAEACRQMAEWAREPNGADFTIRVNLSPAQLSTSNILEYVRGCLAVNALPGHLVCFEITEHALMQNTQQAIETLHALRLLGITLAIDDFGTGFSSMTQLKNLPLDILKIDQTFVSGLASGDAGDRAIVEASVHLARSFGLDIVAEGIETPDLIEQLSELGCGRGQGYLFMRPQHPDELRDLITSGRIELETLT